MVTTRQLKIYQITLLLLFGLCISYSSTLYAMKQDDEVEEEKDALLAHRHVRSNYANNDTGSAIISLGRREWDKKRVNWPCKSIQSCKALTTIMGYLQYWQKVINDTEQLGKVLQSFSASNHYRDIVGAYHHILDKHLNGKNNKEAFRFINGSVQQHITCNFAKCKGYDRNQRDRGNEKAEKDEIDEYGEELVFIRDTLDTIHAYLVHGSDSGHRYSPSKQQLYKVHKRPKDDVSDDEKEAGADTYTLFDKEMAALRKWQEGIKKQRSNQTKTKFSTTLVKQNDDDISFDRLAQHFKKTPTFAPWLQYLRDNACDTDVLLHNIHDDIVDNILYSGCKGDKQIVAEVAHFIYNKRQASQEAPKNKKTAPYGFGVRLYYSDEYKNKEDKDEWHPQYRSCDLYVSPTYPSFKSEILAKKDISASTWNQKMYATQRMLAQSATLSALKADNDEYGIKKGAALSTWHMLSIVFYTDFTALCTAFGESLRYLSASESLAALVKRNSKWYYLSRYLREVVECFGTPISGWYPDKDKQKDIRDDSYYHGVSYLLFTQFSLHWYGTLSTSKQMEVTTLFTTSTNNGLLLELNEDHEYLRFFNVALLSCFGSEDERLFMGGRYPIQIATIRLLKDNINLQQIIHALFMVHAMISEKEPGYYHPSALPIDAATCKDLGTSPTKFPSYARKIWKAFRHQQQRLHIDMEYMYRNYKAFMPLLFDPKLKNVLLLDKIAQLFPNVTEIICTAADCIDVKDNGWGYWSGEYTSCIASSKFILGIKEKLRKMHKYAKLIKVVIQTYEYGDGIKDNCTLYAPQFGALGWQIGKGKKIIVVTRAPYEVICKDAITKISSMIRADIPSYEPTSLDVPVLNTLIYGKKDIPADVQDIWNKLRHQQQSIIINIKYMYLYYNAFIPLLVDPKLQNVLLLDKIATMFPNVTEIICKATLFKGTISSKFILGVKNRLHKIDEQVKLRKIVIRTGRSIRDKCKLYAPQFEALGWQIEKKLSSEITFTKLAVSKPFSSKK